MEKIEQQQAAFQYLLEGDHEVVVFGVLKSLNIRPYDYNYQDLCQNGRLAFVTAYQKYPHERDNHKKMLNYIYQSVRWQILDELRSSNRIQAKNVGGVETLLNNVAFADGASDDVETNIIFENIMQLLNEQEQKLLTGLFIEGKTISQLAKDFKVSRKTLYQWRLKIKQKIKPIWGNTSAG